MCRILAINAGVTKTEALDILRNMCGDNTDGTGEAYLAADGKFVVNKYVQPLEKVIKKGKRFLDHLPHNGWTIIHLRKASIGEVSRVNAHPHVSLDGRICFVHNGSYQGTNLLSTYLLTCKGYTATSDSAAICELTSRIGVKNLTEKFNWGGVAMILNLDGSLEISKVSGQLAAHTREDKSLIIASEFDEEKYMSMEVNRGYIKFDNNGKYVSHKVKEFLWQGYEDDEVAGGGVVHYQAQDFFNKSERKGHYVNSGAGVAYIGAE